MNFSTQGLPRSFFKQRKKVLLWHTAKRTLNDMYFVAPHIQSIYKPIFVKTLTIRNYQLFGTTWLHLVQKNTFRSNLIFLQICKPTEDDSSLMLIKQSVVYIYQSQLLRPFWQARKKKPRMYYISGHDNLPPFL